ncbi:high mobility group B protein 9 isoform X2 [Populus trichocarpa]|uniref:HMG box domain-containing protein n=1 Tax=Populus trichocarpa TaxID=3694 RepID=A0A3N7GHQ3_POPTR|nr:high mobility group B protein 9 isoform X2 [Populus trichocarpa]|eukprot:XP_024456935.1 high mobility group B protein 9 isoform X2 [Populus trichocarpa]
MSPGSKRKFKAGMENKHYPAPLASHEDVVNDPSVFWDTLRRFHFVMGTKFMIPVIGGKELDLQVLYVETTNRGGYDKVVAEKKWREVGSVFCFSATTTSASFVLKKHYFSLLYHYEQVHFFKIQGPVSTPAVAFPLGSPSSKTELAIVEYSPEPIRDCPDPSTESSEVLHGVLYHPDQQDLSNSIPQYDGAIVPYTPNRRRRRRRSRRSGDPSYPKPNRSGYNFFFAEKHYKLKSLYPNREREFTKMIGQSWSSLSAEERMVYQNIGLKDKERYKRELKEYKEKLQLRQAMEVELNIKAQDVQD